MQVYKKIVSVMNIYLISFRVPQNDVMIHRFSAERILIGKETCSRVWEIFFK